MKPQQAGRSFEGGWSFQFVSLALAILSLTMIVPSADAAINWDGEAGTSFWFDPVNWSFEAPGGTAPFYLPTSNGNSYQARDAVVNTSPAGEGIIYDPLGADAANYAAAAGPDFDYPTEEDPRFDRDTFWRMYISAGGATVNNKVTMKSGTMEFIDKATSLDTAGNPDGGSLNSTVIIGRGGASPGIEGWFVQEGGSFLANEVTLDIGNFQTNSGNGFYVYKGGILEVSLINDAGLRLGASGSSGPAGNGTFIIHNSDEPGRIRVWNFNVAAGLGGAGSNSNSVSTVEFHADFSGTRPVQVWNNLTINHQDDSAGTSGNKRSAVLKLVLDEAPQVDANGVPINLGLFDVDSEEDGIGDINGVIDDVANPYVGEDDIFFSDTWDNGGLPLTEGTTISAVFGNTRYDWTLSYNGIIQWADKDNSVISSISAILGDPDNAAEDVVLIGLGSEVIGPEGLPGDFNNDGIVDAADYTVWRNNLGDSDETDINNAGNGTNGVDAGDYLVWKQHYGDSNPGAGGGAFSLSVVPEPSTLSLLGLVTILPFARRRAAKR